MMDNMEGLFLQSPEWEEIQKRQGRKTWRVGGALLIQHALPFGFNYLYAPRPVVQKEREEIFFKEAEAIAKNECSVFLKVDPSHNLSVFPKNAKQSFAVQPRETAVCHFSDSEHTTFHRMHEKTRYNIHLAERKGVVIEKKESNALPVFLALLKETAERDRFHSHPENYYQNLVEKQTGNFSNELFFAEYRGTPVAVALVNFYQHPHDGTVTATYLHGASSREFREVMAPHLLHWRIMQEAKKRGSIMYDLWGIDEKKWPGVTRFKKGFGGERIFFPESFDVVYRKFYYILYTKMRALKKWQS